MSEQPHHSALKHTKTKRFRFHEDNMEPTDAEFYELFDKHNSRSPWFVLMFILSCLPIFCIECERSALDISKNAEGVCIFPELLNNNWTLAMTKNFTLPMYNSPCEYLKFDFDELKTMTFTQAIEMKKNMKKLPEIGVCAIPIDPKTYYFRAPNFLKTCASLKYKRFARLCRQVGEAISSVLMGFIGDLYGRKFGFMLCFPIYAMALMMLPFARHHYTLCIAYFCEGFGCNGLSLLSYILIIEICNPTARGIISLYISSLGILGRILAYYIKFSIFTYSISSIMCGVPSISLLLYLMYMPESPKWQLSYGMKRRAWKTLDTLGVNTSGQVYLPRIMLTKWKILYDNLQLLFYTPKYLKTILIMAAAISVEAIIQSHKSSYIRVGKLKITSHKIINLIGQVFSFLNVLPPFIIFGRYLSIIIIYLVGLFYMMVNMFFRGMEPCFIMNTLTAVTLNSVQFILLLYCCELVPTCARSTAVGMTWVFGKMILFIVNYSTWIAVSKSDISVSQWNYFHFVIGLLSLVALAFLPNLYVHQLPDFKRSRSVIEV